MPNDVTHLLHAMIDGNSEAAEQLLPRVYDELRRLAAGKMAAEKPGQTLNATALVHEAYLRLVGSAEGDEKTWDGRGHFFAAAAEAMRRILIENCAAQIAAPARRRIAASFDQRRRAGGCAEFGESAGAR